ncbi:MAG: chromosomal replication initiator protein DnaA [Candidatus Berkelbacteria bacterium]|nr:chromosomal replication initiator protein DnaA [Candidatus Berkelbacteria bacterium]
MAADRVWQAALGEIEVILPKMQFATWYKGTELSLKGDKTAVLYVPNSFALSWLEKKNKDIILKAISKIEPSIKEIEFALKKGGSMERVALEIKSDKGQKRSAPPTKNLNPSYTFENFVVGNNNSLAYAVAKEVAANPGKKHNPFFVYGGVGLGKTHLAQAIGREITKSDDKARVVYVSCETFTNDFISAIASKKMAEFKRNYRDIDVLIVDDVQFLSAKEGSQQEFFHTYNALHQNSRQIVLTADKIPQAIPALEGRLASRFGAGMVADVQPPDFETRVAILKEKCKEKGSFLPDDVIEFIAKNISSNIRELEGALNRLITSSQLNNITPSPEKASEILKDFISSLNKSVDTAEIISAVCKYYSLSRDEILGKGRKKELIRPRQVTIFLIREKTNKSLPEIGKIMGGKDHTTVLHSERKISDQIKIDNQLKTDIENIRVILSEIK